MTCVTASVVGSCLFWSFTTDISSDLFWVLQYNLRASCYLFISVCCCASLHSLYNVKWKRPRFHPRLSSCPYCSFFSESVCSHWTRFVLVWVPVERGTEQFVHLIPSTNEFLSSAAPSGNAAARPEPWSQSQYQSTWYHRDPTNKRRWKKWDVLPGNHKTTTGVKH